MPEQVRPERQTQNREADLFTRAAKAGRLSYRYFGDWHQRENSLPIEPALLTVRTRLG